MFAGFLCKIHHAVSEINSQAFYMYMHNLTPFFAMFRLNFGFIRKTALPMGLVMGGRHFPNKNITHKNPLVIVIDCLYMGNWISYKRK